MGRKLQIDFMELCRSKGCFPDLKMRECKNNFNYKKGVFSMNLKKIGSALTAISMIASMATYVPVAVSAEGTTAVAPLTGTLAGTVSYSLDTTAKTLSLSSATGASYVIPNCNYGDSIDEKGILQQIAYDQKKSTEAISAEVATIVIDEYATDFEVDAFKNVDQDANVEVHCQSALADKLEELREELDKADGDTKGSTQVASSGAESVKNEYYGTAEYTGIVEAKHDMVANETKHNHYCSYGDYVDNSYTSHDFSAIDVKTHSHICACGKTDKDYKNVEVVNAKGLTVDGYQDIHDFVNQYCAACEGYDEVWHGVEEHLTITSDNATTHSTKCKTKDCNYVVEKEAHDMAVTIEGTTVNGIVVPAHSHYCKVCGYFDENVTHDYSYVYKPVLTDGEYVPTIVAAGEGEEGVVCICGAKKEGHNLHEYVLEHGFHLCACGDQEKPKDGEPDDAHIYNMTYNKDGELVSSETGCICKCGKVDPNHKAHTTMYVDKSANKHYCACGKDITADEHAKDGAYEADTEKQQHICPVCGAVDTSTNAHTYEYYYDVTAGKLINTVPSNGVVCACGAVNKNHECDFTNSTLASNHVHHCICGESSTEHVYKEGVCSVCGALENHEHKLDSKCNCTVKGCGEKDLHDWQPVAGKKYHICANCGRKSTEKDNNGQDFDLTKIHNYVVDKANQTHTCACGETTGHKYDAKTCTCECGATNHTNAYNETTKAHYCSVCKIALGHEFDPATDRCKTAECNALDPAHTTHAFANNATETGTDPDGVAIKVGDELCKCGVKIAHEFALASNDASKHDCTHNKVVEGSTPVSTVVEECDYTPETHTYQTTVVSNVPVAADFCDGCGAVNPDKLVDVRKAYNNATVSAKNDDTYVGKYSTAYLVKLATAAEEVLKYDLKEVTSSNYTDSNDAGNNTTYNEAFKTTNVDKILVANTPEAQADYTAALAAFNTLYAQLSENAAKGQVTISFVNADGTDHSLRGDFLEDYPEVQYGKANVDTVTIKVVAKAGYQFDGWYSDQAGKTKVSDSIAYPVALTDKPLTYYAKFKANDTVRIALPEGAKYASSITKGKSWSSELLGTKTVNFQIGETVYIANGTSKNFQSFTDVNGYAHVYNARLDGKAVTSSNPADCYAFEVTSADTFTLKTFNQTAIESANEYYIVFKNGNKELAASITEGKSAEGFEPNKPQPTGKTCIGWAYEDDKTESVVRLRSITKSGVLVPVYTAQTGLKLDVKNGRFVLSSDATKNNSATGFTYGDIVKLTADTQDAAGKYFSGWYVGDTQVSNLTSFAYPVTASVTIEARYDRDTELVPESMYTLSSSRNTYNKGQQVVLTANWAMSDDQDAIVDTGYVFSFSEKAASELELEDVDGSTIRKKSVAMTDKIGTHVYTMSLSSADKVNATVSAVFYITYINADGVKETVYTNVEVVPGLS